MIVSEPYDANGNKADVGKCLVLVSTLLRSLHVIEGREMRGE